jgi:NTE family protein
MLEARAASSRDVVDKDRTFRVTEPLELTQAMLGSMISFRDSMYIDRPDIQARTIFVDTFGVKATDFDLDEATANKPYDSGVTAATVFLETWGFDEYEVTY